MHLRQYRILQISAQAILSTAQKTDTGYRFCFDTEAAMNRNAVTVTLQEDCALFYQLLRVLEEKELPTAADPENRLETAIVYLDFNGIFDRAPLGQIQKLQEASARLFRPEGIELSFGSFPVRFLAFERSASMSRENKLAFLRADLFPALWERITLGMKIGHCQLSKLYAYNGLMFTSGRRVSDGDFWRETGIVVVDNPRCLVENVRVVTVADDGSQEAVRRYTRVEKTTDLSVLAFDGEGLISPQLGSMLDPCINGKRGHYSFQIRMPYIKGVVHEVDFHSLFAQLGVNEIVDIEGQHHPIHAVDMILTKSMCKGWDWMQENGLHWQDHLKRCEAYDHGLYVSNMDRPGRDGLTELNFQLLNTMAITAEEYRPRDLPMGWAHSPEETGENWLTKATESAYYKLRSDPVWQLSYFTADRNDPDLAHSDKRRHRAGLLVKNPAFLGEAIFQKELADKAAQLREKYGMGKLLIRGDTRYLSDDLMRLLAYLVKPVSASAFRILIEECLKGAQVYAPQFPAVQPEPLTILRNPHISRNEEALVTPLPFVGPLREKYLSHLYYVAMVDSRSLIPERLGGADYDGDTVHLYAEPLLTHSILRNYEGGLENANNLPLLKIPAAKALTADAHDWQSRFQTVKSTFSSRVGQISNAALRRSILAYDESQPEPLREQYRKETEILTILTGLEIDSAKSGIKPELSEYLGKSAKVNSFFLRYKEIVGDQEPHKWYEPTRNKRLKAFFESIPWDEVTANLERTPYYARELGRLTKAHKAVQARSEQLFLFARDPQWRDKLDPGTLKRMDSLIADYDEAKHRCRVARNLQPSGNYRRDIQRILFSRDQENTVSVDALYREFEYYSPYEIRRALTALRDSDWQFTPEEKRMELLYTFFRRPPSSRDVYCDFRCGGYRILGDILMDLEEQQRSWVMQKNKGVRENDSPQLRSLLHGALDRPDYLRVLIQNCERLIQPVLRSESTLAPIDWADAVMCAECLGKRAFILEVLPFAAISLAVDCRTPQEQVKKEKKKAWWKPW